MKTSTQYSKKFKHGVLVTACATGLLTLSGVANAGPGALIGVSYNIGGDVGVTLKVTSSDKQDQAIGAAGVSYFPFSKTKKFGVDVSGGYNFDKFAVTAGYDFLARKAQLAAGYANTKATKASIPAAPTPPPRLT